jgi:hypothetical protein
MKSPDPLDPSRLSVTASSINTSVWVDEHCMQMHVTFTYKPWFDEPGQDVLWEQANALTCLREALKRGGVGAEE